MPLNCFRYEIELVLATESQFIVDHDAEETTITDVQFTGLRGSTDYTVKITCLVMEDQCPGDPYTANVRTKDCTGK